ncbi:hypothetical protein AB0O52_02185 [Arthrobacter sp. NPDC080073]|uniref:hypothetical protein n=1 Tax=Arthrobacter sp. NPDC080073 TaxID=3155919 RepID=UPI003413ABF0
MLTRVQLEGHLDAMVYDKAVEPLGYAGITHYSASKAALLGFTISLAVDGVWQCASTPSAPGPS